MYGHDMGGLKANRKDEKVAGADKCWWVRTEIVIALMNAYRLTKDELWNLLIRNILSRVKMGNLFQECVCKSLKE